MASERSVAEHYEVKQTQDWLQNIIDVNLNWENYGIEWCLDNKDNVLQIYIPFLWGLQAYYP